MLRISSLVSVSSLLMVVAVCVLGGSDLSNAQETTTPDSGLVERVKKLETLLAHVDDLEERLSENEKLKTELEAANKRIADLEQKLLKFSKWRKDGSLEEISAPTFSIYEGDKRLWLVTGENKGAYMKFRNINETMYLTLSSAENSIGIYARPTKPGPAGDYQYGFHLMYEDSQRQIRGQKMTNRSVIWADEWKSIKDK